MANTTKRNMLIAMVAICLIAITAFGTLAFFTADGSVSNKFMVADSENVNPDEIFSIKVSETDPATGKETTTGVTYKEVIPGAQLAKDPTVTNTGMYDQWVRVTVTIDKLDAWKASAEGKVPALYTVNDGWTLASTTEVGKTEVRTYYLNTKLEAENSSTLFNEVNMPLSLTKEDMAALSGFTINVKAEAIQADNTEDTAKATFEKYWNN